MIYIKRSLELCNCFSVQGSNGVCKSSIHVRILRHCKTFVQTYVSLVGKHYKTAELL
jgi:hypothetical protein